MKFLESNRGGSLIKGYDDVMKFIAKVVINNHIKFSITLRENRGVETELKILLSRTKLDVNTQLVP